MNIKKIKIDKNTNFYSCEHDLNRAPRPLGSFYPLEKKINNKFVIFNDQNLRIIKQREIPVNESVVFKKKESKSSLKTIRYIRNDSGKIRHFTPAAQE